MFTLQHILLIQLDQRWQERYEYDVKGFALKQKTIYSKYVCSLILLNVYSIPTCIIMYICVYILSFGLATTFVILSDW